MKKSITNNRKKIRAVLRDAPTRSNNNIGGDINDNIYYMRAHIYSSCFFQRKLYILQRAIYYYVRIFFMGFDSPNEQSVFFQQRRS